MFNFEKKMPNCFPESLSHFAFSWKVWETQFIHRFVCVWYCHYFLAILISVFIFYHAFSWWFKMLNIFSYAYFPLVKSLILMFCTFPNWTERPESNFWTLDQANRQNLRGWGSSRLNFSWQGGLEVGLKLLNLPQINMDLGFIIGWRGGRISGSIHLWGSG